MKHLWIAFFICTSVAHAEDFGYRLNLTNMRCELPNGKYGLNPNFWGECGNIESLNLDEYVLTEANLRGAWARDVDFQKRSLKGSDFFGAFLWRAILDDCDFSETNLSRVKFLDGKANRTNFDSARMEEFQGAFVNFVEARFVNAEMTFAVLHHSYLTGANLKGATLVFADLSHSDLTGANLEGADLRNADLRNSFLKRANLTNANLNGAVFDNCTQFPGIFFRPLKKGMVKDPIISRCTGVRG